MYQTTSWCGLVLNGLYQNQTYFYRFKKQKNKKHSRAQDQHIIIHKWKYSWVKPQHKNKHWEKSDKVIFLLMPSKIIWWRHCPSKLYQSNMKTSQSNISLESLWMIHLMRLGWKKLAKMMRNWINLKTRELMLPTHFAQPLISLWIGCQGLNSNYCFIDFGLKVAEFVDVKEAKDSSRIIQHFICTKKRNKQILRTHYIPWLYMYYI